jgi:magnesium-transporting ATPase (P-type)
MCKNWDNKMERKNNVIFYGIMTFITIIISTLVISLSSYKNNEIKELQTKIDNLTYAVNQVHPNIDTIAIKNNTLLSVSNHKPDFVHIFIINNSIFIGLIFSLFIYILYISYRKKRHLIHKNRKKIT